jgi:hypothetical protein
MEPPSAVYLLKKADNILKNIPDDAIINRKNYRSGSINGKFA